MLVKILSFLVVVGAFLLAFDATALAANAAGASGATPSDLLEPVYRAFAHGEYWYAGALALMPAVAAARQYGGDKVPWLRTETGTATLLLVGSFGASLSARLAGGVGLTGSILMDATKNAVCAAGGYAVIKTLLVVPLLRPLADKFPRLAAPLAFLNAMFDTKGSPPEAPPTDATPPVPPAPPAAPANP